jgi:hypothetical protein
MGSGPMRRSFVSLRPTSRRATGGLEQTAACSPSAVSDSSARPQPCTSMRQSLASPQLLTIGLLPCCGGRGCVCVRRRRLPRIDGWEAPECSHCWNRHRSTHWLLSTCRRRRRGLRFWCTVSWFNGRDQTAGPVVGIATGATTGGYLLAASDGGVFAFGSPFYGSWVADP